MCTFADILPNTFWIRGEISSCTNSSYFWNWKCFSIPKHFSKRLCQIFWPLHKTVCCLYKIVKASNSYVASGSSISGLRNRFPKNVRNDGKHVLQGYQHPAHVPFYRGFQAAVSLYYNLQFPISHSVLLRQKSFFDSLLQNQCKPSWGMNQYDQNWELGAFGCCKTALENGPSNLIYLLYFNHYQCLASATIHCIYLQLYNNIRNTNDGLFTS